MSKHGNNNSKIGNYSNSNSNSSSSISNNNSNSSNNYVNYHLTKKSVNNDNNNHYNNNVHWIFHIDEEDTIDDANSSLLEELEVDPANIYR